MRRTLWLHPGIQRTGTTSIQGFMSSNVKALKKLGVLYLFKVRRHNQLMNEIFGGDADVRKVAAGLTRRANARKTPIHTIVLSDEAITVRRDLTVLTRFKEDFDVKVALFLRRQDLWLESWFFQNVKWQWNPPFSNCTFEEFLAKRDQFHWLDYDRYIAKLEDLFGAENVEVMIFEKSEMEGGPVREFCRRIGITDFSTLEEPGHVNASLSPVMSEFVRHIPIRKGLGNTTRRAMVHALQEAEAALPDRFRADGKLILSHEKRREIMDGFADSNARLAKRRFGRDQLFRDPLPPETAPVAELALPSDVTDLMEHFVVPVFSELLAQGSISSRPKKGSSKNV